MSVEGREMDLLPITFAMLTSAGIVLDEADGFRCFGLRNRMQQAVLIGCHARSASCAREGDYQEGEK